MNKTVPILDTWKQSSTGLGKAFAVAGKTKTAVKPAMTKEQITAELTRKAMTPGSAAPTAAHQAEYDAIRQRMSGNTGQGVVNGSPPSMDTGSVGVTAPAQAPGQGQGSQGQGMTFSNDYMERAGTLMTQLEKMMQDGFHYDYKSDPAYLAAVQQAQEGAKVASRNTLETMNDRGIVNSSVTSGQLGQIEQAAQNEPLKLIPGLENNAYGRYQNNLSNVSSLMNTFLSAGQDERNFQADQQWKTADERYKEADVTGTYESPEALKFMTAITDAKRGWAEAKTPDEKAKYAQAGASARAALSGIIGGDRAEKFFGANVGLDQSLKNFGVSGIQTMASKQYEDEKTYRTNRDIVTDDHWQKGYDLDVLRANKSGSGSGGPSLADTKFVIGQNTEQMLNELRLSGIQTPQEAMEWMNAHAADLQSGRIDPDPLWKYIDGLAKSQAGGGGNGGGSGTPDNMSMLKTAFDMATKDPRWKGKPDPNNASNPFAAPIPLSAAEQNALVQEKLKMVQSYVMPPAPSYEPQWKLDAQKQDTLNRGVQKMNKLAEPATPKKPPNKNGSSKNKHTDR